MRKSEWLILFILSAGLVLFMRTCKEALGGGADIVYTLKVSAYLVVALFVAFGLRTLASFQSVGPAIKLSPREHERELLWTTAYNRHWLNSLRRRKPR